MSGQEGGGRTFTQRVAHQPARTIIIQRPDPDGPGPTASSCSGGVSGGGRVERGQGRGRVPEQGSVDEVAGDVACEGDEEHEDGELCRTRQYEVGRGWGDRWGPTVMHPKASLFSANPATFVLLNR